MVLNSYWINQNTKNVFLFLRTVIRGGKGQSITCNHILVFTSICIWSVSCCSLATAAYGTALGVIRSLHTQGKLDTVYCTETRPFNQVLIWMWGFSSTQHGCSVMTHPLWYTGSFSERTEIFSFFYVCSIFAGLKIDSLWIGLWENTCSPHCRLSSCCSPKFWKGWCCCCWSRSHCC